MKKIVPKDASLIPEQAARVFKGQIFDTYQWQQEMFDGSLETFEMLRRVDTLKVLAVVDSKFVVLYEEQPNFGSFIDVPGGRHDYLEESHLEATQREMVEETGMTFSTWRLVDVEQPISKIEWFTYVYVATDLIKTIKPKLDAGEKISVHQMDFEDYRNLGQAGKLRWWPAVLDKINTVKEILELPEFKGKEIER
jgi:8-oxo-dGTP pyrophosphatase MutT (NUDIX family)